MALEGSSTGYVLLPLWSALPQLSPPIPAAPGWGTLLQKIPLAAGGTCLCFALKFQRDKRLPPRPTPVFSSPRIRALALSQITLPRSEALAEQAGEAPVQRRTGHTLALLHTVFTCYLRSLFLFCKATECIISFTVENPSQTR